MIKKFLAGIFICLAVYNSQAQETSKQEISYQDIAQGKFAARSIRGLRSMADGEHYTTQLGGAIIRHRYKDGSTVDTIFSAAWKEPNLKVSGYAMSDDESKILLQTEREAIYRHSSKSNYWIYDRTTDSLYALSKNGKQQEASISPDGRYAAFVRDNNLWWVDLGTKEEHQATFDGKAGEIINGIPDWVYEEEYSFAKAYHWSPASDKIAYYRFDEREVKYYNMNTFEGELYPKNVTFKYPKAGETNSIVQIKVYDLDSQKHTLMNIGEQTDIYIPRIEWTQNDNTLAIHRLNRLQNDYDLLLANAITGESKTLYQETEEKYIERIDDQKITFLRDGKHFIVKNESTGFMHLYLYNLKGELLNPITSGEWEVREICGVDPRNKKVYYTSTEISPLASDFYSVGINGTGKKRLSEDGTSSITMSTGCKYYICHNSSLNSPTVATLHKASGELVRNLEDNAALKERLAEFEMPTKEFFSFTTPAGDELNGYMLLPHDFDSSKNYPLFMTQYSGPGSQSVKDAWSVGWETALLREGYLVACVDGRGTGGRGEAFRKVTYENLGGPELEDQIYAAQYLGELDYVDSERIGIYGWSYGGFMALNCILKGADVFKMAISVAPVTSWRYYDTIYTELYNGMPQQNPKGYDENSPLHFADLLKGKLLLVHGTADDNVHIQNSYEMIEALTKEGKDFDWLIYPDRNHSMGNRRNDLMKRIINFTKENL